MLSPLLNRWMSDRQGRADKLCPSFMSALPQKQTLADVNRMSSKCQKRTFAGRGSTLPQRTNSISLSRHSVKKGFERAVGAKESSPSGDRLSPTLGVSHIFPAPQLLSAAACECAARN
jgi:hypothetical protein